MESPRTRQQTQSVAICHTCKGCRVKKVKCDGQHPCGSCHVKGWVCEYPQDRRKTAMRNRTSDIRSLQKQIWELKGQLAEQRRTEGSVNSDDTARANTDFSTCSHDQRASVESRRDTSHPPREEERPSRLTRRSESISAAHSSIPSAEPVSEGEGEIQVYGATSLLHSDNFSMNPRFDEAESDTSTRNAAQHRLISQAAISKQREIVLYMTPSITDKIDFDGLPADTAMHLLDVHWTGLHHAYLMTYRPAIMDSLINGGPYINKLLLNAIYMQSSLFSDRENFRLNPEDPQTTGMAFYDRFKALIGQYIDQPTMPTIVALQLCGAVLIPYGRQGAGWVYCGMAYRMMLGLGYHLDNPKASERETKFKLSATDVEIRRRVYWGAYVYDKFESFWLGRPPCVRISDSNLSQEYLDLYEEMAEWKPYLDPQSQVLDQGLPPYRVRPTYAVSTFQSLLQLSIIAEQVIESFYSARSAKMPEAILLQARDEIANQLDQWRSTLPVYLRFDPAQDPTPPPHQIALHTLHWTLVILVEQAFLNRGQFSFNPEPAFREEVRTNCVNAAFKIWRFLEAYKAAFTFRHAHYGLFYAANSAALVMLQQAHEDPNDYIECMKFFSVLLSEYQRGYTRGLKKPVKILHSLMDQVKKVTTQTNDDDLENTSQPDPDVSQTGVEPMLELDSMGLSDMETWPNFWPDDFAMDNTMFGLFT